MRAHTYAILILLFGQVPDCPAFAEDRQAVNCISDAESEQLQPGRVESAKWLIADGDQFKLNASQSSVQMQEAIKRARGLSGQGRGLKDANQYKLDVQAFNDHVNAYRAHLAQVEKSLGHCKEAEAQYEEHKRKLSLHTEKYHIPEIPPPHTCPGMISAESTNDQIAHQLKNDRTELYKAEAELAGTEKKLAQTLERNNQADARLADRSRILEAERKLQGEFAALQTELGLLNIQHDQLVKGGNLPQLKMQRVSGRVK